MMSDQTESKAIREHIAAELKHSAEVLERTAVAAKPQAPLEPPLFAIPSHLRCPSCRIELSQEIDPRSGIQDPDVLICQNNGCTQFGKRWATPRIAMIALPDKKP